MHVKIVITFILPDEKLYFVIISIIRIEMRSKKRNIKV